MRITIVGTSSTGKSTLAKALFDHLKNENVISELICLDARKLMISMNFSSIDSMNREQLRSFQLAYYQRKLELEDGKDFYIAERSFVDIAAYWKQRDAVDLPPSEQAEMIENCKINSARYDLHIYLPYGIVPFKSDGFRSLDLKSHISVDNQISAFLDNWGLNYIKIKTDIFEYRLNIALAEIKNLSRRHNEL